jgi:hypothetical protein
MESALPSNISDNLETQASESNLMDAAQYSAISANDGNSDLLQSSITEDTEMKATFVPRDTYFRQQYGAIYTLNFMLRNKPQLVDWMVEKGLVGSILAAIGTAPYTEIQLAGVRLLLLVHELSPDCNAAMATLLPKELLVILLSEVENSLQYLTAPMCVCLRRIGKLVQSNWTEYFTAAVFPSTTVHLSNVEGRDSFPTATELSPTVQEIQQQCVTLAELAKDGLFTISQNMPVIFLDETFRHHMMTKTSAATHSATSVARFLHLTEVGEAQILADPDLEGFRKYLPKSEGAGMEDDFEKFGIGHFQLDDDEGHQDEQGAMTDIEAAMLEDALKAMDDPGQEEEDEEEGDERESYGADGSNGDEVPATSNGSAEKPP